MQSKVNIRSTFLADDGCVLVRIDLSQIEDRMCKMYCGSDRMITMANLRPNIYDAHTENAMAIFKKEAQDVSKDERYLGKRVTHAAQRKMQGVRMSENVSKDTNSELFIHPKQCDRLISAYLQTNHEIEEIYFPWVEQRVRDDGILVTSWGRRLDLRGRRIDDALYREAYSFYLQAEAADWTNQYGFIPVSHWMQAHYWKPLNAQVHDEVIASVPLAGTWEYARFAVASFEQTREIPAGSGNTLCVPAAVTVARSWGDKRAVEFKVMPDNEDEFYFELKEGGFVL